MHHNYLLRLQYDSNQADQEAESAPSLNGYAGLDAPVPHYPVGAAPTGCRPGVSAVRQLLSQDQVWPAPVKSSNCESATLEDTTLEEWLIGIAP